MSSFGSYIEQVADFVRKPVPYQIQAFGWLLHEVSRLDHFSTRDLSACFDEAHIPRPANLGSSVSKLVVRKPPVLLKSPKGLRLAGDVRARMARDIPLRAQSIHTTQILDSLAAQISDPHNKAFLHEALVCFKHHAYRASIVMAWNLVFSHVCDRIYLTHLATFNAWRKQTASSLPEIVNRSDFQDYKESRIIEICRGARIFDGTVCKTLSERLGRRNMAAHPSTTVFQAPQAEDLISDLVKNVLLNPDV